MATYQKPFTLVLEVTPEATPEARKAFSGTNELVLTGSLDYQACDDKICYNPESVPLSWRVELKPNVAAGPAPAGATEVRTSFDSTERTLMSGMSISDQPRSLDVSLLRRDFPILQRQIHGRPLVYLDNAATTQKPRSVIDRVEHYYAEENANIHRGVHLLSEHATDVYEGARGTACRFLNAAKSTEIIFVRGSTEAINLVAQTYGRAHVGPGDEIVISEMEHHSNIVPWQILCDEKRASSADHPHHRRGRAAIG